MEMVDCYVEVKRKVEESYNHEAVNENEDKRKGERTRERKVMSVIVRGKRRGK